MNASSPRTNCPSNFAFDRLVAGEHDAKMAASLRLHLAGCALCTERVNGLRIAQAAFAETHELMVPAALGKRLSKPRAADADGQPAWWRTWQGWLAPSAGLVAVAAAALFLMQPLTPSSVQRRHDTTRVKGALGMTFYVQHDGVVAQGGDQDVVYPGDALRFSFAAPTPGFIYLLGIDVTGAATMYFATSGDMAVAMGAEPLLMPDSIVLDQTLGREAYWGLHCQARQESAELIEQLSKTGTLSDVAGCAVATIVLEKHAHP